MNQDDAVELQLPREVALLVVGLLRQELPEGCHIVMQGSKNNFKAVIEKETDTLAKEQKLENRKEVGSAMLKELIQWVDLGALKLRLRKGATNLMDAAWVIKCK